MCDQGHELIFNSKGCKIRKQGSRKLVAIATRTPNNIYVLDEIESEKCHLGKEDESWLWRRRMGHIHFDNLVKIYKNQAVRNMPEVTKPGNFVCEQCQHGKQTRVHFKTKENCSTKPLELVHTDLCGPTKRKGLNGEKYFMLLIDDYTKMTWCHVPNPCSIERTRLTSINPSCLSPHEHNTYIQCIEKNIHKYKQMHNAI